MAFEKTHLINLKTADGKTLLIPQIPLRTVVNDGYKLADDGSTLVVTSNLESLKAAIDAQIDGKVAVVDGELTNASSALDSKITALDTKVTTDYATKVYVGEQIAAIDHLKREIVTELPTGEAIDTNTIYMVKMGDQGENVYREYMYIEGKWEIVGDSNIDFSNYYTKGEVDTKIGSYYTKGEVDAALADYVTTEDFNGSIANYALKTELQSTSSTLNAAVVDASSALSAEIAAVDSKFADYALTTYVDAQDGSTLTSANEYADAAVSTAASALNASIVAASSVLNDSITAVDGKFASYYDKDTVDATFAPIDGATLTNVVSITGTDAHIAVSKVTATELLIVNEVQLAGVIVGSDVEAPAARITEDGATFASATVTELLTVGGASGAGSANIIGTLDALDINVSDAISAGSSLQVGRWLGVNAGEAGAGMVTMGSAFTANTTDNTVMIHDEWTDGETTSSGFAAVATEHDITSAVADANEYTDAASSNIMSTINALPGIGEGAILYDVIEELI